MNKNFKKIILIILVLWITLAGACSDKGTFEDQSANTGPMIVITGTAVNGEQPIYLMEMKKMKDRIVEKDYFSLNSYGTKEYFRFKGIPLWDLIEGIDIKQGGMVKIVAEDGYSVEYTLDDIRKDDYMDEQNPEVKYKMIIAWEENGKEYDPDKGNPFRLVVGQREPGDVNKPNWVQNIKTIQID